MRRIGLAVLIVAAQIACDAPADTRDKNDASEAHGVILTYHHVAEDTPSSTSVTPRQFDAHMDFIARNGYVVWPVERLTQALRAGEAVPADAVAITFDDAYESVFTNAWPRLRERDWPFTVFVNTDAIDQNLRPYMRWAQLRQLVEAGVTIGNHSRAHAHMPRHRSPDDARSWRDWARADIEHAQRRIQAELGVTPTLFAYPYGEYDAGLRALLLEADLTGFGQHSGAIGRFSDFAALPRFPVAGAYASIDQLATRLAARPLEVSAEPPGPLVLGADPGRPALTLRVTPGKFSPSGLACYATGQGRMALEEHEDDPLTVTIKPVSRLAPGRSKYNCTVAHAEESGSYFWWSYLLMAPHPDGRWYTN